MFGGLGLEGGSMVDGFYLGMTIIWAIYNDLSRGHPERWFRKGILPKMAEKFRLRPVKDLL